MAKIKNDLVGAKKGQSHPLVIQNITFKSPTRDTADIAVWRNALKSAEGTTGKRIRLYDLYEDLLLDNVLGMSIEKRIMSVNNSNIVFQVQDKTVEEMDDLVDSGAFETFLTEVMLSKFWGITVLEFDFTNGFQVYTVPRKHIDPKRHEILLNQTDEKGIPYLDDPFFMEIGGERDLGLILRAAPYVIYKRGGFGDWAQFAELFGMPFRIGKYNSYDEDTRVKLEQALEKSGSAPWAVIPADGSIEYKDNQVGGNASVYKLLKDACNEEILIGILGQTMTSLNGSSKSQSETHKDVEESINRADRRFIQRILNRRLIPVLEARGYPVKGGWFSFPEAEKSLTLKERMEIDTQLIDVIDIDPDYFYETYGVPKPEGGGTVKKKIDTPSDPDAPVQQTGKKSLKKLFSSFFLKAPAGRTDVCQLCGGYIEDITLAGSQELRINNLIERVAREIYEGKIPPGRTDADLMQLIGEILGGSMKDSVGNFNEITFEDESRRHWLDLQQNNIYKFGLAKSYSQLKALRDNILGNDGTIKPFGQFMKDVESVNNRYNRTYLETEHMAVVRGTVMGSRWLEIEENKEVAPYLQYVTAGDERVREEHAAMNHIIEPVDSKFWDQYYPPNGWRCRCTVSQLSQREAESLGYKPGGTERNMKVADKNIPDKYWRKNTGKSVILEADDTAYVDDVPGGGKSQLKAVDHYGLQPFEKISMGKGISSASQTTREEFGVWWKSNQNKGNIDLKDPAGMPVRFDESFRSSLLESQDYIHASTLTDVVKSPNEIWAQTIGGRKLSDAWQKLLIKWYDNKAIAITVNSRGLATGLKAIDPSDVDSFRKGVLLNLRR